MMIGEPRILENKFDPASQQMEIDFSYFFSKEDEIERFLRNMGLLRVSIESSEPKIEEPKAWNAVFVVSRESGDNLFKKILFS